MDTKTLFQHGQILAAYATESLMRQWCEKMNLTPVQEFEVLAGFLAAQPYLINEGE